MLVAAVVGGVATLMLLFGGTWALVSWNEARLRLTDGRASAAQRAGLHYAGQVSGGGHRYSGVLGDRRVAAEWKGGTWTISTRLARPVRGALRFRGPALLGLQSARILPAAYPEWTFEDVVPAEVGVSKRVRIDADTLEVRIRGGGEIDQVAPLVLEIAQAIEDSHDRSWLNVGRQWGLVAGARVGARRPPLTGLVDDRRVEARFRLDGSLEVRAAFHNPRLHDLTVTRRDEGEVALELDNPVIGMLLAVWHPQLEVARAAFANEELCELVLAVVHAHPGSRIQSGVVQLRAQAVPDDELGARLNETIRLAGLLTRA